MQIHGPAHVHGPQPINAPHRTAPRQDVAQPNRLSTVDQLDISQEADLVSRMREVPDVRMDRVQAIRAEIEAGAYESDDKLEAALDRLLDEIG